MDNSQEKISRDQLNDSLESLFSYVNEQLSYLHKRVNENENNFYDFVRSHTKNHLPNPSTPSDMEGALKSLGLLKDYEVEKIKIRANLCKNNAVELFFE